MDNQQPKSALRERARDEALAHRSSSARAEFSQDDATQAPTPSRAPSRTSRRNFVGAGVIAILLAIGGGYAVTELRPTTPHIGITTATGLGQPYAGTAFLANDALVSEKQWQERAQAFNTFKSKGPAQLDRAEATQINAFVSQAVTDPQQRQTLLGQVQAKQVDMVALGLYDDCAEDGDVVNVRAGPVNVFVPLKHQIQYVLIPVPHGGTTNVAIAGQSDGQGGGITVGMVTPADVEHLPRLTPGQQVEFTVR